MKVLLNPRPGQIANGQDIMIHDLLLRSGFAWSSAHEGEHPIHKRPDLIISHNPDEKADLRYANYYFEDNVPIVTHLHCQPSFYDQRKLANVQRMMEISTAIVVPHSFMKTQLLSLGVPESKIAIISNGANIALYYPASDGEKADFRRSLSIKEGEKLVGYVGPLTPRKGLDILSVILSRKRNFVVLVQYPYWDKHPLRNVYRQEASVLESYAKVLTYRDTSPRLPERPLRFLDMLLSVSLTEVQPITILEALQSGVKVVATKSSPFIEELDADAELGPFVSGIDIEYVARMNSIRREQVERVTDSVISVIEDSTPSSFSERKYIQSLAARRDFSDDVTYRRFITLYDRILHGDRIDEIKLEEKNIASSSM